MRIVCPRRGPVRRPGIAVLLLLFALVASSLEGCLQRTPYERMIIVLETGQGIKPIRTPDWRWEGCLEPTGIPNAYQVTRTSYVLFLAHSTEPHIAPALYLAALDSNHKPLNIEGPTVKPIFARVGEPLLALEHLGVQATHYVWFAKPSAGSQGVLVLTIGDGRTAGHEELRYHAEALNCVEYQGS